MVVFTPARQYPHDLTKFRIYCTATSALALLSEALEAHQQHNLGLPPAGRVPHSDTLRLQLGEA